MKALERELVARGHDVAREVLVDVMYKGEKLASQRLDLIVDRKLIVEVKSTHELHKSAARQVYNYLHATDLEVGLLLHFGPDPKFHRLISPNRRKNPPHPSHPPNPLQSCKSQAQHSQNSGN